MVQIAMESKSEDLKTSVSKTTLSIRLPRPLAEDLRDAANELGTNLSETGEEAIKTWLRDRKRSPAMITEAIQLAYGGPANAGLVRLIAEVMRELTPRGQWLDDPAAFATLARGIARLFARLRAPEDVHVIRDEGRTVEGKIDHLLFWIGDTGEAHHGALTTRQEWARDIRSHLGDMLSGRLIAMHVAVRDYHQQQMPADPSPVVDPKHDDLWGPAIDKAQAETAKVRAAEAQARREADEARRRAKRPQQKEK